MSTEKQERIGKVLLDYTWYSGQDLYTDGEMEDRLLEIVKSTPEAALNAVIAQERDWTVLYHLSHIRENITDAVPIDGDEDVLEIGSGCGAVTGSLARRARSVTCIDLSRKRSLVNACRHQELENLQIYVGNFKDIEEGLADRKYDVITLIGVFEYGAAYIGGDDPYGEFLRRIRSHLKEGGRLAVAIENRLGLKYFAGAREDHTGGYFDGLEDYPGNESIHTFSRPELSALLEQNGFSGETFYYPYPDYKLPTAIYSDACLPREGSLNTNIWNFDRDRLILFDETKVYDSLIRSGLFPQFANSFLVMAYAGHGSGAQPVYFKFSNDRSRKYSVTTQIGPGEDGRLTVYKTASYAEGWAHIANMARHCRQLQELFAGTKLKVNRAVQEDARLELEYLPYTQTLADVAGAAWKANQKEACMAVLRELCSLIEERAALPFAVTEDFQKLFGRESFPYEDRSLPVTDLDMIADNILIDPENGSWTLIDYEWTVDYPVPVRFVLFRIWHYFHAYYVDSTQTEEKEFLEEAGFTWPEALLYLEMEQAWQERIDLEHHPLRNLYAQITPGCKVPREVRHAERNSSDPEGTAYFGRKPEGSLPQEPGGETVRAEEKVVRGIPMRLRHGSFETTLSTKRIGAVSYIRWDPVSNVMCKMQITSVISPVVVKVTPLNGFRNGEWDEFWSLDPAYLIEGDIPENCKITLKGNLETIPVALKLPDMDAVRRERDGLALQVQDLSAQLLATRSTKAFRAVEKLRRARNFVMARVRALPPFREKAQPVNGDLRYQEWLQAHSASAQDLELQRKLTLPSQPKISILVPTWNTPETYLREMIDSVRCQTYGNWELCIADASVEPAGTAAGGARNQQVAAILEEYAAADPRIRYVLLEQNLGISGNTNAAAKLATGDYVGLLDHDDMLAPDALFEVAAAVNAQRPDVLYTDEDKMDMDAAFHFDPNLKPDFAPDLLRSHNYITHFFVAKRELLERIGYFRSAYDGAQDYDLILRATEQTDRIWHIPKILYYWRNHPGSTSLNPESKLYAYEAGTRAIAASLQRCGEKGSVTRLDLWGLNHVRYETPGDPLISVIIPNKDHIEDLRLCIESLLGKSTYRNLELVVVENNSVQPETFAYYEQVQQEHPQVRVVRWEREFNYSAINNYGARCAKGDILLLLNNDTELLEPDSLGEMLGLCLRPEIGCVGAKLLFADDTVQHCGIILGPGGFAGHVFSGIKDTDYGFMMRAQMTGNWSAVTAACLMVRREVYEQVGGLSEEFAVALNDVDFCMKVRARNYRIVCTPFAKWHHFESKSRGYEDTPEKKARFEQEVKRFRDRWGKVVDAGDPYYNANLSVNRLPFSLW